MINPPISNFIIDMQVDLVRFAHVAKHLYNPRECWCQVIVNLGDPRCDACNAGCTLSDFKGEYPDGKRVTQQCLAHVLSDHDKHLAPAYRDALAQAETASRVGRQIGEDPGWMFVGDGGVVVIVRKVKKHNRFEVKSAYRVVPKRAAEGSREDFLKEAVRKLRDKTSWSEEVRDELR